MPRQQPSSPPEIRAHRESIEAAKDLPLHRLRRSLYGRCSSGTTWIRHFFQSLTDWGYESAEFDRALWCRQGKDGPVWVAVYVDDLLATGGTMAACIEMVRRTGAEIAAATFLIELEFLEGRRQLGDVEIHSAIRY